MKEKQMGRNDVQPVEPEDEDEGEGDEYGDEWEYYDEEEPAEPPAVTGGESSEGGEEQSYNQQLAKTAGVGNTWRKMGQAGMPIPSMTQVSHSGISASKPPSTGGGHRASSMNRGSRDFIIKG
jgi:hypothetical protein